MDYFWVRGRFGNGWFSYSQFTGCLLPRQLPLTDAIQKEFTTLRACVFLWN